MSGFATVSKERVSVKKKSGILPTTDVFVPGMVLRKMAAARKEWQNSSRKLPS
jgi:hypothetical protein